MAGDPLWRTALLYARAIQPRVVERPLWRWRYREGFPPLDAGRFRSRFPWPGGFLPEFAARTERRFGLGPGKHGSLRDALQRTALTAEALGPAVRAVGERHFDVLGSGPIALGRPIDWHADFVHGERWEPRRFWEINYSRHDSPRDVKLPWEVARCHWMVWLGEARLLLGDQWAPQHFRDLAVDWLDGNPVGMGIHWACPMELAIRGYNWILALAYFADAPDCDEAFWLRLLETLWWHGEVIRGNLEYGRRLNNHYLADGFGLFAIGLLFLDLPSGRRWHRKGRAILEQQIRWQVHPDGVSYEKSVSYHRLVLEFLSAAWALAERSGAPLSPGYRRRLEAMHEFVAAYSRTDGSTPLVSDADDGRLVRPDPGAVLTDHRHAIGVGALLFGRGDWKAQCGALPPEAVHLLGPEAREQWEGLEARPADPRSAAFPAGGYYILRGPDTHTFCDGGPIGFEGDAVHGHNDTLSFELAAPGGTFIVDSGTYCYTSEPSLHREFARTKAHNTVEIDGLEVAEMAGLWRLVADTTDPELLEWTTSPTLDRWSARHRGYMRLADPVTHQRTMTHWKPERRWLLEDQIAGRGHHRAVLRLHLHPEATVRLLDAQTALVRLGGGMLRIASDRQVDLEPGWVAPTYGVRRPAEVIRVVAVGQVPLSFRTEIAWQPSVPEDRER